MSKIEKALEKAVKMREDKNRVRRPDATPHTGSDRSPDLSLNQITLPKFEIGESVIDPAAVDKYIVCITEPLSSATEQYKKLRVRILKATEKDFLNTIMVTSPDIGDGKTITAINLAVAIANEIDHTVLLVDTDLRNPFIHKYLGIESRYGLSDYLKGEAELSNILIRTGIGKLVFLPGGNPPENAAELLSSEKMKRLVHEMKLRYKDRYIIFDSSPVLIAADSLSLGSYMDGIVFVIQAARTSEKAAEQAISLMKGCNILGIVFNNVPQYLAKSLYPYYYHYGYKRDEYFKKSNSGKKGNVEKKS
ncbi:MAG: polysaccharide biosynthesis tyrosine autokinase [Nitrospirota bacterium]